MKVNMDMTTLQRALEARRMEMVQVTARKAVHTGAVVIAEAMQTAAPMLDSKTANSTALEPGALKADIRATGGRLNEDGELVAYAGPSPKTAHVADWVEYGHRMVHGGQSKIVDGEGRTRGPGIAAEEDVRAHPFLRPAFESSVTEAEAARDEVLRKGWEG